MSRRSPKSYLVFDIETVPDATLWTPPEPTTGQPAPFPPAYAHQTIVIGCLWLDDGYRMRRLGLIGESSRDDSAPQVVNESEILEEFSRFISKNSPSLVTYNGRTFDLPVIALRSLRHGVEMAWYYREPGLRYRYSEDGHIDLCDWLADHGATRYGSLDALAKLIGLPGKRGMDGSQIEGLYRAGDLAAIHRYCLADVAQTALLFLRFRLLQGVIARDEYRAAVSELTRGLRADPRLAEFMQAVDGERLLSAA